MSLFTFKSKLTGSTPSPGETAVYVDPASGRLASKDDAGLETVYGGGAGAAVFGTARSRAFSGPVSINATTTPQTKVQLDLSSLVAGDYLVKVGYFWNHDLTTSDFVGLFEESTAGAGGPFNPIGNSPNGEFHRQEPKDNGGSGGGTGTDQVHPVHYEFTRTLSGDVSYRLQFSSSTGGDESSIWDAYIEAYRVA